MGRTARTAKITSMHREQQPVQALHKRSGLGQLTEPAAFVQRLNRLLLTMH